MKTKQTWRVSKGDHHRESGPLSVHRETVPGCAWAVSHGLSSLCRLAEASYWKRGMNGTHMRTLSHITTSTPHVLTHAEENPNKCYECGKEFKESTCFYVHQKFR